MIPGQRLSHRAATTVHALVIISGKQRSVCERRGVMLQEEAFTAASYDTGKFNNGSILQPTITAPVDSIDHIPKTPAHQCS